MITYCGPFGPCTIETVGVAPGVGVPQDSVGVGDDITGPAIIGGADIIIGCG